MNRFKGCIFFLIFLTSHTIFAYTPSEGKVSGTIGPYLYKTNFAGSASGARSVYLGGVGLIADGDLGPNGGLEISLFHMNKVYFRHSNSLYIAEKTELVHIGMGYRYWMNPYFSTALSFYSAYSIGSPFLEHSDFAPGAEIDSSARDTTEYGFEISLQSEVWSRDRYSVVLDGRYAISVTSKQNEDANHYGILVGLKYMIQEKSPEKAAKKKKLE